MKRYIPIVASLMVFSLISCGEVMDLTQPEKAEVTYSNITLSLYQTGKYDLYLDEPEYQYNIMVEKSHCEKEAKAKLAVVDAKEFGEEYHLLPVEYYDLDGSNFNFKGDDVLRMVNLRFHDLGTLDGSKKYVLGLKLVSDDLAVNQEKSTMTFFLQQKQGEIDNPYTVATTSDLITLGEKLKDGKTIYAKIENDIDLQGVDWQPIETSVSKQLVLDGGGHTIRNLKVNTSSSVNQGFFGLLVGKCSNINFENAQITANTKMAGILAGQVGAATSPGIVENVRVSGTISLTSGTGAAAWDNGQAGGICARLHGADSKIHQCTSATDITAVWCAGGICGETRGGATISQCSSTGDIVTESCVGGIVGRMLYSIVTQCYSSGLAQAFPMKVANPAGGIAGFVDTGTSEEAAKLLEFEGFMLGINGVVTFKKSTLPEALTTVPLERIVLETDSPYLAPVPNRGKRNESANVRDTLMKVADIYQMDPEYVAQVTSVNALKVFGIRK